jgi:hypothetical protein
MKTLRKHCLPLLIIIMLISCNKSTDKNRETSVTEQIITVENENFTTNKKQNDITQEEFDSKMNEDTIAAEIALALADRMAGSGAYGYYKPMASVIENVSVIDVIIPVQGYYIQQSEKQLLHSHTPEILTLSVEDEKIIIREVDLLDRQIITRNEIILLFDGKTFSHNQTKLETQDGILQIVYLEHAPEQRWRGPFEYEIPYTFAGILDDPIDDNVRKLTSDYLKTFTGEYIFDSGKIIRSSHSENLYFMRNNAILVMYNNELKCLTIPNYSLYSLFSGVPDINSSSIDFIGTEDEQTIYWLFGESAGYTEVKLYFYKGGIVYLCNYSKPDFSSSDEDGYPTRSRYSNYVVFFRKET